MRTCVLFACVLSTWGCGDDDATEGPSPPTEGAGEGEASSTEPREEPSQAEPVNCDELLSRAHAEYEALTLTGGECEWDGDCVLKLVPDCCCAAPVVVNRGHSEAWDRAIGPTCDAFCDEACVCAADFLETRAFCALGVCQTGPAHTEFNLRELERQGRPYPPNNSPRLSEPPARPEMGTAEDRARRLFSAIRDDDPESVLDFFFPRSAFLLVKAMDDPGSYHDRLIARYQRDIHDLHESLGDLSGAEFVRLELVRRGGWVPVGEEGNRVPYWVSRHSWLHYRIGEQDLKFEVRVLITWNNEWFITHLNEFH